MASPWQRLLSALFLGCFALLIWLAITGRFDHEVNQVTRWLHLHWIKLHHLLRS